MSLVEIDVVRLHPELPSTAPLIFTEPRRAIGHGFPAGGTVRFGNESVRKKWFRAQVKYSGRDYLVSI